MCRVLTGALFSDLLLTLPNKESQGWDSLLLQVPISKVLFSGCVLSLLFLFRFLFLFPSHPTLILWGLQQQQDEQRAKTAAVAVTEIRGWGKGQERSSSLEKSLERSSLALHVWERVQRGKVMQDLIASYLNHTVSKPNLRKPTVQIISIKGRLLAATHTVLW